jgi:glycosyltransferase involved in cell wall biosynthesis
MGATAAPHVSVIMNCYNGEKFLREAIDSVFAQSFSNWEIVFFDNASVDSSADIAREYDERLKYFKIDNNVCLGEARNLAMQKATGKYVAFLDCDDLYLSHKLEDQVSLMDQRGFVMSYGGAAIIREDGSLVKERLAANSSGHIFGCLLKNYDINMQSVMLLRSYILEFDLSFPTDFQYGPDYDLFMDISAQFEVGVLNQLVVKTRLHAGALTHKKLHRIRDELKSTIDRLVARDPSLKNRYSAELSQAYSKFEFYEAVYLITSGSIAMARATLRPILFSRWEYMVLYVLLFLPIPKRYVLRLLNR